QRLGRRRHALLQRTGDLRITTVEKIDRQPDLTAVILFTHQADTGRSAALDLVLQAGPRAVAKETVTAIAQPEHLLHHIQCFPNAAGARVRTEIARAFLPLATVKAHTRKCLFHADADIG